MYAVGSEYAHAEARKSPVVDGKVLRNQRGKEQRYPLILTGIEKEIARKVVLAFGQTIKRRLGASQVECPVAKVTAEELTTVSTNSTDVHPRVGIGRWRQSRIVRDGRLK